MASSPKEINPVGNPIQLRVVTTNHVETSGVFASLSFNVSSAFNPGTSIELLVMNTVVQLDFVTTPDNSGFQLQGWLSGVPWATWFESFLQGLRENYYIGSFYAVSGNQATTYVNILAFETGDYYNILFNDVPPANIANVSTVVGVDETNKPNFAIYARIKDAETGEVLGTDRIAGSDVVFDFHEYLQDFVFSKVYFPEVENSYPAQNTEAVKEFYIEYWEQATGFFTKIFKTENYKAICGGVNRTHEALIDVDAATYIDLFRSHDILFQSARPATSHISLNQPLHFYFINPFTASRFFSLDLVIHYTDSTTLDIDMEQYLGVNSWAQGCLFVSPGILQLEAVTPGKTIKKLVVKIVSNNSETTDEFTLIPYRSNFLQTLVFKNSFGAYDHVPFFGYSEFSDKYSREIFTNSQKDISLLEVSESEIIILNSGWITKDERNWIRDLLLSKEVYLIQNNMLQAHVVLSEEILRHKDNEYLYAISVKLQRSLADNYFSNERTPVDASGSGYVIGTDDYIIGTDDYDIGTN